MPHQNKFLIGAMVLSFVCTVGVIYLPFLSNAFGFERISLVEFAVAILLAVCIIPIMELVKAVQRRMGR